MKFTHYLGIDVSKETFDMHFNNAGETQLKGQFTNTASGAKSMGRKLLKEQEFSWEKTLVCLEYTGIYVNHLLKFLISNKANIWLESGTQIKWSLGLARGKDDPADAKRIAEYCFRFQDKARLYEPARPVLNKLKKLSALRNRLLKVKEQLSKPVQEARKFEDKSLYQLEKKISSQPLKAVNQQIKHVDKLIAFTLAGDKQLKQLANKVSSVTGVGPVITAAVLVTTNEFKGIKDPKKFSCYAGVAPFKHQSGTSIRGKVKVSNMANKKVKKLLHLGAMSAIKCPGELKEYYDRKVAEGKNKMLVINAVRNKIIHRIFAVVRENRRYERNYESLLV